MHPGTLQRMGGIESIQMVVAQLAEAMALGRYPWWYPDGAKGKAVDYFIYGVDFTGANVLGANQTLQLPININGDSAFCTLSAVVVETDTGNTVFLAQQPVLVRISDAGSGRFLSNIAIHMSNWFGTAEQPKYWDIPKIYAPNSVVQTECQNLEAVARNVRLAYHGFKIFDFRP